MDAEYRCLVQCIDAKNTWTVGIGDVWCHARVRMCVVHECTSQQVAALQHRCTMRALYTGVPFISFSL